jgi:hypothetical protein
VVKRPTKKANVIIVEDWIGWNVDGEYKCASTANNDQW